MNALATLDPKIDFGRPGLRFVEVRGDSFMPVVSRGDFMLVAPVKGWQGEADYFVECWPGEPSFYRCQASGTRQKPMISMGCPNPLYREPWLMARDRFEALVVGIVVMTCQVQRRALLQEFTPAI